VFFKKGLRDLALIRKFTMKNPKTSETIFAIANKYALAEEATLDTREQKKEKNSSRADQTSSSKGHDKKRKVDRSINAVEQPWCNKEYRPRSGEFEGFLDHICIFHPQGKHKTQNNNQLQGFIGEVPKMTKGTDQEKKLEEPKRDFFEAHKEVNYIYGGPDSYESRWKQKLTAWEVMTVAPATPEYLKWSEVPITFNRSDHPDFVLKPEWYPLIVSPIVKDIKLNQVLINGGSSLNILFLKTFDQMGLSRSLLHPSRAPFHSILPGAAATPIGRIVLLVTFGTQENFYTETIQFEVANFETAYNTFLGRPALSKFMAIPHYAYLVLKMPGPRGIISIRGDVKRAFDYDRESCKTANRLTVSAKLQELKQALVESPQDPVMLEAKTSMTTIQPKDTLSKTVLLSMKEPSKVAHVGNNLDPK
jgi:hypothetical protein